MTEGTPPPSRLALLRFLRRYVEQELGRIDTWIAHEERAADEERREHRKRQQARPPAGDWIISDAKGPRPGTTVWLHTGGCWDLRPGMRPLTRAQALDALGRDGVHACPSCRPDRDLGVLE
ncbi:DUF6233 domain-containing protein [Streptomyces sp. NRRL F-5126]|uniref:DUF6233 domain-containing protein n=1 Tax=Streptomyces sp. NRRL F-5126 TaxID=1463857 RepID=UPI0004C9D56B|nr:DUF6233 domain-containing protein [Streptomyces sp. NRRL F-5126]